MTEQWQPEYYPQQQPQQQFYPPQPPQPVQPPPLYSPPAQDFRQAAWPPPRDDDQPQYNDQAPPRS